MRPLTFYATIDSDSVRSYMPDVPYLLPASSWSRKKMAAPKLPPQLSHTAADCGGFVATFKWGDYRYTPEVYEAWLHTFNPHWAATMDYCCEPEVMGKLGVVRERQQKTTTMAHLFWKQFRRSPWCWVPTVQGWDLEDYQRHARELRPLIEEMADYYGSGSEFRVGIGTLCRRADVTMIRAVVNAVAAELPGVGLHLWGVKLSILQAKQPLPDTVISVDSAAWNGFFGTDHQEWQAGTLSKRQHSYQVALPRYIARVEKALATPKQHTLMEAA